MKRTTTTIAAALVLASCAGGPSSPPAAMSPSAQSLAYAQELERLRRVNENWHADCTTDAVTGSRECLAGTFGRRMDHRGNPMGEATGAALLHVYFIGQRGPFLRVGSNTFPGRTPTIRLDDGEPVYLADRREQHELVERMRHAKIARARYHVWPEGPRDMIAELEGFDKAWNKLLAYVSGDAAPSDPAGTAAMRARDAQTAKEEIGREDNSFNQLLEAVRRAPRTRPAPP